MNRTMMLSLILLICIFQTNLIGIQALHNGLALTPPMGWISWERFTCTTDCDAYPNDCINENLYKKMADHLAADGYHNVGYKYINIDDCWSEKQRDQENSNLVADKQRFPSGMNALAEYIHKKGLKFGIYGDCGIATCAGYPAQLKSTSNLEDNYFSLDADRFADWQVDSLKFDSCNLEPEKQESICPKMAEALHKSGKPILLICEYPLYMLGGNLQPDWKLVSKVCNAWRYFSDVEDSWQSVLNIVDYSIKLQETIMQHHGPGHWFDPDQLIVGNYGLSLDQARAQMALWCVWSAPLYMSNDLRSIEPDMAGVLKNQLLIQVNQDRLGIFGQMVAAKDNGHVQAFVKPVEPASFGCPSFVIVYLNRATLGNTQLISFNLRDLLLKAPIALAGERQLELPERNNSSSSAKTSINAYIDASKCLEMIRTSMTKQRVEGPSGLVVDGSKREIPIREKIFEFELVDLFGDAIRMVSIDINSTLSLGVNPSGVRAIKISPIKFE